MRGDYWVDLPLWGITVGRHFLRLCKEGPNRRHLILSASFGTPTQTTAFSENNLRGNLNCSPSRPGHKETIYLLLLRRLELLETAPWRFSKRRLETGAVKYDVSGSAGNGVVLDAGRDGFQPERQFQPACRARVVNPLPGVARPADSQ